MVPAPQFRCIAVLGPTASGKSAVALALARRLDEAPIISCDSMQIYKGMDIGTGKVPAAERQSQPHHLIDELDIHTRYSASDFVRKAHGILARLPENGPPAILEGGTGLYARALIYGLQLLPADRGVFQALERESKSPDGMQRLQEELARRDPDLAEKLAPNPRHLLRAVEVLRLTGKTPPECRREVTLEPEPGFLQTILMPEPQWHRRRIRRRVEGMIDAGWIEETARLVAKGLLQTPTARQALGYRDIADYLAAPAERNPDELVERIYRRTVQYARRQRTWFRHQHPGAHVLDVDETTTTKFLVERILTLL